MPNFHRILQSRFPSRYWGEVGTLPIDIKRILSHAANAPSHGSEQGGLVASADVLFYKKFSILFTIFLDPI